MTTLLAIFLISLLFSLISTPVAKYLGQKLGAMDMPNERKCHQTPIPRNGGLAIVFTFFLTLCIMSLFNTDISNKLHLNRPMIFLFIGSLICFGVGLFDDFKRLGPYIKFSVQILAASVAFMGGIRIEFFHLGNFHIHAGILSYFITVFWFVFFINAINLIDGLDGLAAGVTFFACIVLVVLSILQKDFLIAVLFTTLSGSILGFLRYNFNPASIFMGDGGSYFLGYIIAGLSVMGAVKSQLGAAMLIPLVALGVPIFDTMISPLRRFMLGQAMFKPDKGHIHHRLIEKGLSARRSVLIIYAISICLCLLSILLVNFRNEQAGLFLIILGSGSVVFIRKIGYFDYFATDKIYGWFRDVTDEAGFTRDRRTFLSLQLEIINARELNALWGKICNALERLEFDMAELIIHDTPEMNQGLNTSLTIIPVHNTNHDCRLNKNFEWIWIRDTFINEQDISKNSTFKIELPLLNDENQSFGTLLLIKDLQRNTISHYTLRRVEHLRRSIISALAAI
ncbi:MAG: undecaprenyl/decaprenyl-phosphate alpha-N-acetylglucosaminyl 1-phosphate transferase [Candidatus Magnetomorum sp.]|nr:undecaprenyl/decaprenyl-phosphate alpha-N-acetylglucosaminyl 1-phosphate transferase [Candidatus Magnetomorum sp.]